MPEGGRCHLLTCGLCFFSTHLFITYLSLKHSFSGCQPDFGVEREGNLGQGEAFKLLKGPSSSAPTLAGARPGPLPTGAQMKPVAHYVPGLCFYC